MAEYTLEQIKAYKPPKKLPEIAGKIYDLYDAGGFKLSEEALEKIRVELRSKHHDLKALTDDLCGLSAFIMFAMETRNDPVAAEQVANLIKEQRSAYAELGEALATLIQDQASSATDTLGRFLDTEDEAKSRAPMYGETAPAGAVPLKSLKPVAQPPVPRKKK